MRFDVFISYPHQDKATADAACAALENAGIRCWIAPRDVPPGAEWAGAIVDAIDHCRAMVLIFSSSSNGSKQVHREVQRAFDKEVPVVPLRIENVAPESSLAYYMGPVHWLDALTPPLEEHLQRLAASVEALVRAAASGGERQAGRIPQGETKRPTDQAHAFAEAKNAGTANARPTGFRRAGIAAAGIALLLAGWIGLHQIGVPIWVPWAAPSRQPDPAVEARRKVDEEAATRKKMEEAAAAKKRAQEEAEAAAKRKAEEEAALKADEARKRADAEEKAKAEAQRDPALGVKPGSGQSFRDLLADGQPCPMCPEMVVVPAGSFTMGSPLDEQGRVDNEGPNRKVAIGSSFSVGKFPVTRGEFAVFINEAKHESEGGCYSWTGSEWKIQQGRSWRSPGFDQDDRHPVVCVTWNDAKAFAAWVSQKTGKDYRLLAESEREYVTRAGTTTRYFFGDGPNEMCRFGNGADLSLKQKIAGLSDFFNCRDTHIYTAPVGSFQPNAWGVYDVHGNVWDWIEDCWHDGYRGAPDDGSAWLTGDCSSRILRGGSWDLGPRFLRVAHRGHRSQGVRSYNIGFRIARPLTP